MAKYEILLIVSGTLDEAKATEVANEVSNPIAECKPEIVKYGAKQLAYKIKNDNTGYYFQYNFECESPAAINEYRRLCLINKNVLRHLIINLEKDYAYKASVNAKKIEANKKTAEINAKRKAEFEKMKAQRDALRAEEMEKRGIKPEDFKRSYRYPRTTDGKPVVQRPRREKE
ncbi:MAG: 30S ribosomal protein S6 [Mycoplasma sp.]